MTTTCCELEEDYGVQTALAKSIQLYCTTKDYLTFLIAQQTHWDELHLGPTGMMGIRYNILGAKALVRRISKECVKCQQFYAKPAQQLMGQLPPYRAIMDHPFTTTGADFAGPFKLRKGHTRKPVAVDGYACLFVCMSTKCIRIELVMDMTTDSFLAALRDFVARRGRPAKFVTDNDSNFVGAIIVSPFCTTCWTLLQFTNH